MQLLFSNKTSIYFICLLGLFVSLIVPSYSLIFSLGLLIVLIYLCSGKRIIIFLSVVSLLALTHSIGANIRTVVQYLNVAVLLYLFLHQYGLNITEYPRLPKYISILFILLFTSMVIATYFSNYRILGVQQIFRTAVFFTIIYIIYSLLKDNNDIRILLVALFTVGLIFSIALIYGLYENHFNIVSEILNSEYVRKNSMGGYIIIVFSIALSFILLENRRNVRMAFGILILMLLTSLFITNSRGAILGVVISTFFLLYKHNRKSFLIFLTIMLFAAIFLFIGPLSDFIDLYFRLDKSLTGRDVIWSTIYGVIRDNPIFGVGPAATKYVLYNHLTSMLGSPAERFMSLHYREIQFGHAHNFYLFFWSDLGILGLITSVFLPISFFKLGYQNLRKLRSNNTEYYYLTLGILSGGLGLFVRGIYEWSCLISYGTISIDMPFWLIFIIFWYINFKKINKEEKILSFK